MSYTNRFTAALAGSIALHLLAAAAFAVFTPWSARPGNTGDAPLVVKLEPPRPQPQPEVQDRRLIDTVAPAEAPPQQPVDLIAETHSQAQDTELRDGDREGPVTPAVDDFDALARLPEPQQQPAPRPAQEPAAEAPRPEPAPQPPVELPAQDTAPPLREDIPALEALEEPASAAQDTSRMQLAQATPQARQDEAPAQARTRGLHNAVKEKGFTSFAALQDEIAPYLKEIRDRVERQWRHMLLTRYSGTSPTKAVIDCAIAADGTLISVTVVGDPEDRVYAALCRQAVEKAGPFDPFPFEVPDLYRSKNLEIRWTFGFL